MRKIINLTPHPIHLLDENNNVIRTFVSEGLVRLKANTVDVGFKIDGCKVTTTNFGEPEGLPKQSFQPAMGGLLPNCTVTAVYYIVSQLVKSALPDRTDLLVPAEVVRDANGNIIGCKSFGI